MKNTVKILAISIITSLLASLSFAAIANAASPFTIEAYGMDTIAGYSASIYSSKTLPNKNVVFNIIKPDGSKLEIAVESDDKGVAEFDLYDYHTKQAGDYKVSAKLEGGNVGPESTFTVFADEISIMNSKIEASKLVAKADGRDKIFATVNLKDGVGNPIQGHIVEVIPSRSEDLSTCVSKKSYTDENGSIVFALSSTSNGLSIYSFIDTTSNTILSERLEVVYKGLANVGGDYPSAYADAGEVFTLVFENLPSTIAPNSDVTLDLVAYDNESTVVPNYTGTVHFSTEGPNGVYASLPNDYTFDMDLDAGRHTFSGVSSLNFSQEGSYKIIATDLSDFSIRGEITVSVGAGTNTPTGEIHTSSTSTNTELAITSPSSGTYGNSQLEITGVAPASNLNIQIFDNDQTIGTTKVESDKTFSFKPTLLREGKHEMFVVALDAGGTIQGTSNEVVFYIDTLPPEVEDITYFPSKGIKTGDIIEITITSETDVYQGAVVFNVDIAELEQDPNNASKYTASIQAPMEAGIYPVDIILVDELGNEGSYESVITIQINADGGTTIIEDDVIVSGNEVNDNTGLNSIPGDVFGVRANASDQKVTLNWEAAQSEVELSNYKIYYGIDPVNLNMSVTTSTAKTTWYVPNLTNGTEYYFAITAVDKNNHESKNRSTITSSVPFSMAATMFVQPDGEIEGANLRPVAPEMSSSGPEVFWFILMSIVLSQIYFKFNKKTAN
ncbi:Ig-like domain-containing protein [Patescibacteria group bacterium]|nr:Ig-like domain-containing protein [Patescibacteria group bacterium]